MLPGDLNRWDYLFEMLIERATSLQPVYAYKAQHIRSCDCPSFHFPFHLVSSKTCSRPPEANTLNNTTEPQMDDIYKTTDDWITTLSLLLKTKAPSGLQQTYSPEPGVSTDPGKRLWLGHLTQLSSQPDSKCWHPLSRFEWILLSQSRDGLAASWAF